MLVSDQFTENNGQGRTRFRTVHVIENEPKRPPVPSLGLRIRKVIDVDFDACVQTVMPGTQLKRIVSVFRFDHPFHERFGRIYFLAIGTNFSSPQIKGARLHADVDALSNPASHFEGLVGIAHESNRQPTGPIGSGQGITAAFVGHGAYTRSAEHNVHIRQGFPRNSVKNAA